MVKEFVGHLTFNFSNDGLVYAADRAGNRIHVTDKQGNFKQEIRMAEWTGIGGVMLRVPLSHGTCHHLRIIPFITYNL